MSRSALNLPTALPNSQQGASVTGIILLIIGLVIGAKLLIAIVPAQIGDYQLSALLAEELKKANAEKDTAKQYVETINRQLSINADYDTKAEDVFTFTNERVGDLAIHKKYAVTNNFFGNVDIVNRFDSEITDADAK